MVLQSYNSGESGSFLDSREKPSSLGSADNQPRFSPDEIWGRVPSSANTPSEAAPDNSLTQQPEQQTVPRQEYSIPPGGLIPNQFMDVVASLTAQRDLRNALTWHRENNRENASAVPAYIVPNRQIISDAASQLNALTTAPPESQQATAQAFAQLINSLVTDVMQNTSDLGAGLDRHRTDIAVNLQLLIQSLNQELNALGAPVRFGDLRMAVDVDGHLFFGLPIMNGNDLFGMIRIPPLPSQQEIQRHLDSQPRLC